ncbi:MAG TPA: PmoA family protein [Bryobacteraceae bacterium]|jgi:hypothetical protein|nr:PmoA family protein [Bryobacteraceae bacterium]
MRQALKIKTSYLIPLGAFLALSCPAAAQVQIENIQNDHLAISINGQPFSDFYYGRSHSKPYLAPLRSATGLVVTRRFPMERVEGESRDHPHHKGLWIGFGDINGINFWETEPESKASGNNPKTKGVVRLQKLESIKPGAKSGSVSAVFTWSAPEGRPVLEEQRKMVFYADDKIRRLDVDATFTARQTATFADTKEGFFAIRVADSMAGKNGGILTNAEGAQTEKDVWGKRADWVDYVGTVEGQKIGILILDNPRNPNHPPRWHARDYGLFAVNPFGEKEFDPHSTKKGGFVIPAGQSAEFRYRVIIHSGDESKKAMAHWYSDYVKGEK